MPSNMLPFNEAKDLGSPCSTRSAPVLAEEKLQKALLHDVIEYRWTRQQDFSSAGRVTSSVIIYNYVRFGKWT